MRGWFAEARHRKEPYECEDHRSSDRNLFVILAIVAFLVSGETPATDDSPREIVDFYLDNDDSQAAAAAVLGLGCVALIFFLGSLRRVLRAEAGDEAACRPWLSSVAW